ncbi:protein trichome birefringence-like 24 [Chenopodium quinoa]|uniref:protein trichome birefringence-like 24 n=1 Tax=Chenopodium quinoa TaxID=63459 RepID=UPI000B77FA91|nr:protein trichome birefringence-like 24 [Chenopodium quinoa]
MKTNTINPSLSYDKIHNARNRRSFIGVPPFLLWFLVFTSFLSLFLLYSPKSFHFTSQQHKVHERRQQEHHFLPARIKYQSGDDNCDLFKGKWVPDLNGSKYTTTSCVTIPDSKNCFKNGRIDIEFVNWRWKPDNCELPRFDPRKFLKIVGGKKLAFVGDSVARNQMESLLCLLSQVNFVLNYLELIVILMLDNSIV